MPKKRAGKESRYFFFKRKEDQQRQGYDVKKRRNRCIKKVKRYVTHR